MVVTLTVRTRARSLMSHDRFSTAHAPCCSNYQYYLVPCLPTLVGTEYLRTVMSDDQATAPLEEMETSLAPGASTRPAGEIKGLISATGDVEVPEPTSEGQENEREREEEAPANAGPEQQIIEGAVTILGLNGDGGGGSAGGGGGQSKPSEGIMANVIRSIIGAPFYPLKLVQVHTKL